jgi:hypothetical protein
MEPRRHFPACNRVVARLRVNAIVVCQGPVQGAACFWQPFSTPVESRNPACN